MVAGFSHNKVARTGHLPSTEEAAPLALALSHLAQQLVSRLQVDTSTTRLPQEILMLSKPNLTPWMYACVIPRLSVSSTTITGPHASRRASATTVALRLLQVVKPLAIASLTPQLSLRPRLPPVRPQLIRLETGTMSLDSPEMAT